MISHRQSQFGPTQKDVAKALQLSQSAIARALGSRPHNLPSETVARIHAKAEELGYRPQRIARILRNGRSHTIGVVFRSSLYHAPQERVTYLAQQAIEAGYQLVAADITWFGNDERAIQDYLLGAAVEGVIFCNVPPPSWSNWGPFLKERSIPTILLNTQDASTGGKWDEARPDIRAAFCEITRHHLERGSRRLAFLLPFRDADFTGTPGLAVTLRVEGFVEAVAAASGTIVADVETARLLKLPRPRKSAPGSGIRGEILYPIKTDAHTSMFELGRLEAERMICEASLPESLICSNDAVAAGALSACLQHSIAVPQTVRISGADDAPFSAYCGVPLTTVLQPSQEMTRWAIERMVELIEKPAERSRCKSRVFPCRLVPRQSTASTPNPSKAP